MLCRMFNSIPDVYLLGAGGTPHPKCDNQECVQTLPDAPWGTKPLPVRTISLELGTGLNAQCI